MTETTFPDPINEVLEVHNEAMETEGNPDVEQHDAPAPISDVVSQEPLKQIEEEKPRKKFKKSDTKQQEKQIYKETKRMARDYYIKALNINVDLNEVSHSESEESEDSLSSVMEEDDPTLTPEQKLERKRAKLREKADKKILKAEIKFIKKLAKKRAKLERKIEEKLNKKSTKYDKKELKKEKKSK